MSLFDWLFDSDSSASSSSSPMFSLNPATNWPMANDAVDVCGNPYGVDLASQAHDSMDWMNTDGGCSTDTCCSTDYGCSTDICATTDWGCAADSCGSTDWGCSTDSTFD